ncbi:MAG: FAD:protein FMN transferase [Marinosulfonomonas sp.]|nr:FAD:protein FMN transferase [Marinosulfonomonas sp.]
MTTRRRMLTVLAGAALLPAVGAKASANTRQWRGVALGAEARIILDHPRADALIGAALQEIQRLEAIFSLYLPDSQLSRLNRDGVLDDPAFEMIELLSICSGLNARTGSIFDPTVQPLWALYAQAYSAGRKPGEAQVSRALELTGWNHVAFSTDKVSFGKAGVQLTLNGIAQGYIADKVTGLFRANGVRDVLVNTGEIAALGRGPDGQAWQVNPAGSTASSVPLRDRAIATSRPLGTAFDPAGQVGHILHPKSGNPSGRWSQVSVISGSAADADGLSTAFCLMSRDQIEAAKGDANVLLV